MLDLGPYLSSLIGVAALCALAWVHIGTDLGTEPEFVQARRIINGTDKAVLIAGYAVKLQDALIAGGRK